MVELETDVQYFISRIDLVVAEQGMQLIRPLIFLFKFSIASSCVLALTLPQTPHTQMKLWADLRTIHQTEILDTLARCEAAADSPVDAILVTDWLPSELPQSEVIFCSPKSPNSPLSALLTLTGEPFGLQTSASNPSGQSAAISAIGSTDWIHLDVQTTSEWTMIPCENVISICSDTPTNIAATAISAEQVQGLAFALDMGVDALVLKPPDGEDGLKVWEAASIARAQRLERSDDLTISHDNRLRESEEQELTLGVVTSIVAGGVGDRVALDFTSLLRIGEGALVGSSSKFLALVHGETVEGALVPSRPFRVNAGPVHSYVAMSNGRTKYLEEVEAGDEVLILNSKGVKRSLTVGRCKVEPRPFVKLTFEPLEGEAKAQIFLQQAETVRVLVDVGGGEFEAKSVTEVKVGERLRMRTSDKGTHVGRQISARVDEK